MNIIQSNLNFGSLNYGNNPNKIILHHAEASSCTVETIHDWHKNGNGWAGIGYHYFVRKDGNIYTGRPVNAIGAHCPSQNSQSIGICAEGSYMSETMPAAQKNAIIELVNYLKSKYGISEVGGHRDYYSTDCPGTNYPMDEIKKGNIGTTAPIETPKKYIVCYNNQIDKRSADYLAEFLNCASIDNSVVRMDYSTFYPICIGGGEFTGYCKKLLMGLDRWKTMKLVADFIEERR